MIKRIWIFLSVFLFFEISWGDFSSLGNDQTRMISYNIGQGNFTVLQSSKVRGDTVQKFVTIVDGGFSEYPILEIEPDYKRDRIAKDIYEFLKEERNFSIYVILSHPDKDHYNLIKPLLEKLKLTDPRLLNQMKFHLGFDEAAWDKGKPREILDFIKEHRRPIKFSYNLEDINMGHGKIKFLYKGYNSERSEKNDNSLVALYEFGNMAVLLSGDATQYTLKNLEGWQSKSQNRRKKLIALASHHGANDPSNTDDWVRTFKPDYVVVSTSATNDQFKHPAGEVLARYGKYATQDRVLGGNHIISGYLDLKEMEGLNDSLRDALAPGIKMILSGFKRLERVDVERPVFFGATPMFFKTAPFRLAFETDRALYSTADQGDIAFTWGKETEEPEIEFFKGPISAAPSSDGMVALQAVSSTNKEDDDEYSSSASSDPEFGGGPSGTSGERDGALLPALGQMVIPVQALAPSDESGEERSLHDQLPQPTPMLSSFSPSGSILPASHLTIAQEGEMAEREKVLRNNSDAEEEDEDAEEKE